MTKLIVALRNFANIDDPILYTTHDKSHGEASFQNLMWPQICTIISGCIYVGCSNDCGFEWDWTLESTSVSDGMTHSRSVLFGLIARWKVLTLPVVMTSWKCVQLWWNDAELRVGEDSALGKGKMEWVFLFRVSTDLCPLPVHVVDGGTLPPCNVPISCLFSLSV